jgi:hypothetical protein
LLIPQLRNDNGTKIVILLDNTFNSVGNLGMINLELKDDNNLRSRVEFYNCSSWELYVKIFNEKVVNRKEVLLYCPIVCFKFFNKFIYIFFY